ncbi:hypothetical protein RND71_036608 [Anisodus tanguticus]|uniref:Small auxin up regulated protein n=1 Tax=Anisodus tanguticus TaxID=243964 RepID=A0AAE1R0V1_9SOLA|nr:hypothetical protein RND71_036608 [Anisodus tanguticus]
MAKRIVSMRILGLVRMKKFTCSFNYVRLRSDYEIQEKDQAIRKGYVPIVVGNEEVMEKILIPMKLINYPCFVTLLDFSAHELGYNQEGTLRILCQVESFKRMIYIISKRKYQ